jgi:threonine/homoserine/homoserine lactone efflux protein
MAPVLSDAIGDLLPSAFAVALSPIPIVAVVLVLGAPRARAAGPAFALGWVAGLVAVSVVVVLVLGGGSDEQDTGINWLKVAIGILFWVMAAKQWQKRPKAGEDPAMPSWMTSIDSASPPRAAVIGAALSGANPKNLALTLAASASIAEAGLNTADTAIAIVVFVALGSVTVAGLVLFYLPRGQEGGDAVRARRSEQQPRRRASRKRGAPRRQPAPRPDREAIGHAVRHLAPMDATEWDNSA